MVNPAVIKAAATIGSSLIGAGGNVAGAALSFGQQKALQANQAAINYKYAEKSARNQPTWNRAGLEQAGYNPMLAVQNSTSGANSSWTSAQSANAPDIAGGISSGIANAQSFQRLKNETLVADQTSKKLESEGENLNADTANKLEENKYIGEKRKKEIANIQADTLEKEARVDNMQKRLELDRYINDSGLATTRRGQDLAYNASTYATNTQAETQRGMRTDRVFGLGSTYYDMRGLDERMRTKDSNDSKYWRNYY